MKLKYLDYQVKDQVATVTVNRPEVMNAFNNDCWQELGQCIDAVNKDDKVLVAVLTGAGDKAFIAGADVTSVLERDMFAVLEGLAQGVLTKLENCLKPTIAAVNGFALGGGCETAMACDIRLASDNARFGLPELNLGIIPGAGGTQRLARLVGVGRAKEMIMTGRALGAQEALSYGLVTQVVPLDELEAAVNKTVGMLLKKGPFALRMVKKLIQSSLSTDQETGLYLELLTYSLMMGTGDKKEGITAFLEKRDAEFTGK